MVAPETSDSNPAEAPPPPGGAADDVTAAPPARACLACGEIVQGCYCGACGQKHDDCRRNVFSLVRESFEDAVGYDARIWRTLIELVRRPGRPPREYTHGRRSKYTPPIRLYLISTLVFLASLALTKTYIVTIEQAPPIERPAANEADAAETVQPPDPETAAEIAGASAPGPHFRPHFFRRAKNVAPADARFFDHVIEENEGSLALLLNDVKTLVERPQRFNAAINQRLPWVAFAFAPVLALMTAAAIRGRDALVYDHLVFAFNYFAVAFFVVALAVWASQIAPGTLVVSAVTAVLAVYYVLSLKGAFGRGWAKTVFAAIWASVTTLALMVATLFVSVILIAFERYPGAMTENSGGAAPPAAFAPPEPGVNRQAPQPEMRGDSSPR